MLTETYVEVTLAELASDSESGLDSTVNELEALSLEIIDFWQEGG